MNNDDMENLTISLVNYLANLHSDNYPWCLKKISGRRGIFATRDIEVNELIFIDRPLIIGPIGNRNSSIICVACYASVNESDLCPNKCGLPICVNCPKIKEHSEECSLLREWHPRNPNLCSYDVIKALPAVRGLLLSQEKKMLLGMLQANRNSKNEEFIDKALANFESFPKDSEMYAFLKLTASILNTNAFQTVLENNISIKGLYPLTGLLNHECTPNTRHSVDLNHMTRVFAVKKIEKGEELTTTYSQILWNTPSRRTHLLLTKQFICSCNRCIDPAENITNLTALKCFQKSCPNGLTMPLSTSSLKSDWQCKVCQEITDFQKICNFLEVITSMVKRKIADVTNGQPIIGLINYLKNVLVKILPQSNQLVVEVKLAIIWNVQNNHELLNDEILTLKETYCLDILQLLAMLSAGECTLAGLISFELFRTRDKLQNLNTSEEISDEQKLLLNNCWTILKDNLMAPKELASKAAMHL